MRLLAICVVIVATTYPAWTGGYIYDDWLMGGSDKMDGSEDLVAVFGRSSADYLGHNASTQIGAVTYRPLSMLSLIAVQVATPDAPLAHHLVSLLLHLGTVSLLFVALRAAAGIGVATLAAIVFGLHPLGVEAHGWINGRSDALAGLGIVLIAWALSHPVTWRRVAAVALGAMLASLAKETALVAVLGMALSSVVPSATPRTRTVSPVERWLPALTCLGAVLVALLARALVVGDANKTAGTLGAAPGAMIALVRLLALAMTSISVPLPRTMRNLGYELAQPLGVPEVCLLLLGAVLLCWLLFTRRLRECVLLATAAAMVAPCVLLRHAFWLGCDRYLYIPLLLLCIALGRADLEVRLAELAPLLRWAAGACAALVLAVATFLTAQTYHDQSAHMLAMIRMRADDPTGYLLGARWLLKHGNQAGAEQLVAKVAPRGLPHPLASQLATLLGELHRTKEALAVVADMDRRYPDDPYAQLDVLAVSFDQGWLSEAKLKAQRLRGSPHFCRATLALLDRYLAHPDRTDAQRATARKLFDGYTCP